jgi:alkylation response protein AidB-like acyl-CoA dehydrogenase
VATQVTEQEARQVAEDAREREWTRPSFGKGLFMGDFDLGLIHPQPRLDPEAVEKGERFLAGLRSFLEREVDPFEIEREAKIPEPVIDGLKELGALGMKVPEEYGGLGLSQVHYNQALSIAGVWHSALSTLLSAHQSIGVAQPLMAFGSEEQKREWLPKVSRTHISAFLLTEPDVGSDPARMGATAEPTEDGKGYRLNGTKLWATNGAIADVVVVMAKVPKHEPNERGKGGISAFILPYDSDGIRIAHRNQFMGLRGIENSVTLLEDVYVPNENLIGREGEGLKIALTTLNTGRLALPAICVGVSKWATKIAREWGAERVQWGQPVGKHDAVAQKISFIAGTAFGLEAMLDVSSRLADDKKNDIRIEAALAKLYASELAWQVTDELMQIRGGRGYETADSLRARGEKPIPVEQVMRDMRINRTFEGSSEIMHLLIAREAVDQHLEVAGDVLEGDLDLAGKAKAAAGAGRFYAKWLPQLLTGKGQSPSSYEEFGELAGHVRFAERNSRKLARSTFWGMSRWQAGLEKRQSFLGRIVDIGAELFAIASACTYAQTIAGEQPERAADARALADLFCTQARRRVDVLFRALWFNDDDGGYKAALDVLDGRHTWIEEGVLDPSDAVAPAETKAESL